MPQTSTYPSKTTLRAGAAEADITPKLGTQIAGDIARYRPARIIEEPIFASALVLERERRTCCVVSMNITLMTRAWADPMRRQIADMLGTEPAAVMLHATQNHSAPAAGHFMLSEDCPHVPPGHEYLRGGDDGYLPLLGERVMRAVRQAADDMRPAWFDVGRGFETRVAFNRRFVLRDGSRTSQPTGAMLERVLHVDGPIDPEVGVAALVDERARPIAMMLHHTCHPVHFFGADAVLGSWPGAWSRQVKSQYGGQCVPVVLNGCCGNVHHKDWLEPGHDERPETLGARLMEKTQPIVRRLRPEPIQMIDWRSRTLPIRFRDVPPERIEQASRYLAEHPDPPEQGAGPAVRRDWYFAVSALDLQQTIQRTGHTLDYEIQAFRIGDTAIVAVPGEPFVETQLRIKAGSPARQTLVAHYANDYVGYVPTPEALADGSTWETRFGNSAKLAPEALEQIADATVDVLQELFRA